MREDDPTDVHATVLDRHDWKGWVQVHNYGLGVEKIHKEKVLKIIGHPITHADLFRALELTGHSWESVKVIGDVMEIAVPSDEVETFIEEGVGMNGEQYGSGINYKWNEAKVPLNYRTVEDIPEDDPCWKQLCNVFGLTPITK